MTLLRRLSWTALGLAYAQIVFGAIVRITGSGMGCGDHWPKCLGHWVPPLDRADLIIEWTHRLIALLLGVAIAALLVAAVRRRGAAEEPGQPLTGGPRAVLRAATLAATLYVTAAILGAITVWLGLHSYVIVVHLAIAMSLLATLAAATMRAGGLGARTAALGGGSARTWRGARAAAALVFVILLLGALTANLPGAAASCQGFPLCRNGYAGNVHVQLTHRVLAFLIVFHLIGLMMGSTRRKEAPIVIRAVRVALATVLAQIVIAAALVEMHLPPVLQSLHQAVGTLVWLATFTAAALALRASRGGTGTGDAAAQPPTSGRLERRPPGAPAASAMLAVAAPPEAAARKPHTVAVIIARGADF